MNKLKKKLIKILAKRRIEQFETVNVVKYSAKCRMSDGSEVYFGNNYKYTKKDFDCWVKSLLLDDVVYTDDGTYIKTKNIIETSFVSLDKESIVCDTAEVAYEWKWSFSNKDIDTYRKEYDRLQSLIEEDQDAEINRRTN